MDQKDDLNQFTEYRKKMNDKIFALQNKQINRFFALDTAAYLDGALSAKIKELMGLATSMVLRCEDCIKYHIIRAVQLKCTDDELAETMSIAMLVGGSIIVPEMRRAVDTLSKLRERQKKGMSLDDLL